MKTAVGAFALVLCATSAQADFIDTVWTVTGYSGEPVFDDPASRIGQTQEFYKGFAAGTFYGCDYAGQMSTYTTYSQEAFFANPEFAAFDGFGEDWYGLTENLFVHRITCAGTGRVLYPFITLDSRDRAYYLFENGIYLLETQ